ncbi:MAG: DUF5711 family protein [Oscillospiraceae bacterium]|nr:DUF5711 family protein [Oscillospiraceae bacterium]
MTSNTKNKSKKRRPIRTLLIVLSLSALLYAVIYFASGKRLSIPNLSDIFNSSKSSDMAEEYLFQVGHNRVYASLDNSIVAVGTLGMQILGADGNEIFRDSFKMTSPSIKTINGYAIAYDIGGSSLRLFKKNEIITSMDVEGEICSVSINPNAWISVCTQENNAYKGIVTVYNNNGSPVYKVNMASGYVLASAITADNKSIAVLSISQEGSRIIFYNLDSEETQRVFDMPGTLILDLCYLNGNDILAITPTELLLIKKSNESELLYSFDENRLSGYVLNADLITLSLTSSSNANYYGYQGLLVTLDKTGRILGEIETNKEPITMASGNGFIAITQNDGVVFYTTSLDEITISSQYGSFAGATAAISLNKNHALVASDYFAYTVLLDG